MSLDGPVLSGPFENYVFPLNLSVHRFSLHSLLALHLICEKCLTHGVFPQSRYCWLLAHGAVRSCSSLFISCNMALHPTDSVRFIVSPFGETVKGICFSGGWEARHTFRLAKSPFRFFHLRENPKQTFLANPISGCFAFRDVSSYIGHSVPKFTVHQDFTKS